VFALLGQGRLGKPRRLRWAASLHKSFSDDPLLDRDGHSMHWVGRMPPGRLGKLRRLRWAAALHKSYGVDPLLDRDGHSMHWVGRMPPVRTGVKVLVVQALFAS